MRQSNTLTILGIDPGLADTGYAVANVDINDRTISKVQDLGRLSTRKSQLRSVRVTSDFLKRVQEQAAALRDLVQVYNPAIVACEMVATTPYTLPTFSFGAMMGIIAGLDLPIVEVLPAEVKRAVTGRAAASKSEIIAWAMRLTARQRKIDWPTSQRASKLGLQFQGKHVSPSAEHQADALAIVKAALATEQFRLACVMAAGQT